MPGFGAIAFAAPWVLAALVVLPVVWWLLRVTPPAPRRERFPAIRLLQGLIAREETPARTPWWLLLLRLVIAALIILALSGPLLNPQTALPGRGPLILVVDNGWAAGRDWTARQQAMDEALKLAERAGRAVIVLPTARPPGNGAVAATALLPPAEARRAVQGLEPQPWPTERAAAVEVVRKLSITGTAHAVWLADGLGDGAAAPLAAALQRLGSVEVREDGTSRPAHVLLPPAVEGSALVARVVRADASRPDPVTVRLSAADGRLLAREPVPFQPGETARTVRLEVPAELRNEAASLRVEGETTAAAAVLLDERWRRRPVGLVSGRGEGRSQPLLSDLHYLNRALEPYNEVRRGAIADLLQRDLAVLILSDVGTLTGDEVRVTGEWVKKGGVLLRFAGPRLAGHTAAETDGLVPVRLRAGDRSLGGALSWSEPARLQPFDEKSPFRGLSVPADVTVQRQVLAEPSPDLADRTWARLADGTPLVTAEKRGDGWVVLVHTTAAPEWSNLPLSGLFVDMLRRLAALSGGVAGAEGAGTLDPLDLLDGRGRLAPPPATALPLPSAEFGPAAIGPRHPPGFYGTEDARRALNLSTLVTTVAPFPALPPGVARTGYGPRGEVNLKPLLLAGALGLLLLDLLIALALRGLLRFRRATAAAVALVLLAGWDAGPARADDAQADAQAVKVTAETYLAYLVTGDRSVDDTSRAGLEGLVDMLGRRTAVEAQGVMAVDPERDEMAFYPLLYWAVTPSQAPLSDTAKERLNRYMRNGGVLLIDTRDQNTALAPGAGAGTLALQGLTQGLDIPPLGPVPPDHVLTKSFYLMQDFPGRYTGAPVWIEARESGSVNDGVSPVVIGAHDWAAAWAVDPRTGAARYAVVPGGERQRELAFRFGINVVMYALTGNYKADQVHVPAILERLGQ